MPSNTTSPDIHTIRSRSYTRTRSGAFINHQTAHRTQPTSTEPNMYDTPAVSAEALLQTRLQQHATTRRNSVLSYFMEIRRGTWVDSIVSPPSSHHPGTMDCETSPER